MSTGSIKNNMTALDQRFIEKAYGRVSTISKTFISLLKTDDNI